MMRLSVPARQALGRLTLPVLVVAAFAMMLLGKADMLLAERARIGLADALAPVHAMLSQPLGRMTWLDHRCRRPDRHARRQRPAAG